MLTLQSLMLVALGVLVASLIVVVILPSYRSRVQRLTSERIQRSLPLTEAEIRADQDRLRAQFAIRVHKLEAEAEQFKLNAARQRIELNRRDARITELNDKLEEVRAALEENVNARRVLEHTVTDRLPRLEMQLDSARALILERDQEMGALRTETTRSVRALDEAMQMNAQLRAEVDRMASAALVRQGPTESATPQSRFDGELALRSEIEALRAKTREQAQAILSLQTQLSAGGQGADVDKLRRELVDAEIALKSARDAAQNGSFDRVAAEGQVKALNEKIDAQAGEIARLMASLAVYEAGSEGPDAKAGAGPSRLASKAKLSSLQTQVTQQNDIIQRLRAELAASNERLARQAAQHMEEMRRLGSGTVPTSLDPRRAGQPRRGLVDRISLTPRPAADAASSKAPSGDETADPAPHSADDTAEVAVAAAASAPSDGAPRKVRLLDRIAGSSKS